MMEEYRSNLEAMKNRNLTELELELKGINEYLKTVLADAKSAEALSVLTKRSSLIREIEEVRWSYKSLDERKTHRENKLIEMEKYFHKYGDERDVARKYRYQKNYYELVNSVWELESVASKAEREFSSIRIIANAIYKILDAAEFIDIYDRSVHVSLEALFECLSLGSNNVGDSLQEKIDIVCAKYSGLKTES